LGELLLTPGSTLTLGTVYHRAPNFPLSFVGVRKSMVWDALESAGVTHAIRL